MPDSLPSAPPGTNESDLHIPFDTQPPPSELCYPRKAIYRPDIGAAGPPPPPPSIRLRCVDLKPGETRGHCVASHDDAAAHAKGSRCFVRTLALLHREECMIRLPLSGLAARRAVRAGPYSRMASFPFYVLSAPWLTQRRDHAVTQLTRAGIADATLVHCANGPDLGCLTEHQRFCLHPTFLSCDWHNRSLTDGTLSLSLKHKVAFYDSILRKKDGAVVLEDDFLIKRDIDLLNELGAYLMPRHADIFFLGSYSRHIVRSFTLPPHPYSCACEQYSKALRNKTKCPLVRRSWMQPHGFGDADILGSVGYVVFASAAPKVLTPVIGGADVANSFWAADPPPRQYGPTSWLVHPANPWKASSDPAGFGVGGTHYYLNARDITCLGVGHADLHGWMPSGDNRVRGNRTTRQPGGEAMSRP